MSIDGFLSALAGSYQEPEVKAKVAKAPNKAPKDPKDSTKVEAPVTGPKIDLPSPGSIDAKEYILRMRKAMDRDSKIAILAAYCGYDSCSPFGPQESSANDRAKRELRPLKVDPTEPFKARSILPSASGFIAGMPEEKSRRLGNLLAREKVAAASLSDHLKVINNPESSLSDRETAENFFRLESERIRVIREEIREMTEGTLVPDLESSLPSESFPSLHLWIAEDSKFSSIDFGPIR